MENEMIKEIFEDFIDKCDIVSVVCPLCRINVESAFFKSGLKNCFFILPRLLEFLLE